ncbi:MAG: hypothetical protein FWD27_08650 [Coriobacteriia bacterium]|nr:hypothetical protein [Coriobacteriia bacterium]
MSRPLIGTAITPAIEEELNRKHKELTALEDDSEESIYHQVFSSASEEST